METSDECNNFGPCAGDPNNPFAGGCMECWDMQYGELFLDGNLVGTNLVGGVGTTGTTGSVVIGPICTNGAANANLDFSTTVHGAVGIPEAFTTSNAVSYTHLTLPTKA